MAMLKIYIPDSQFEPGGQFEKYSDNRQGVQVPFVGAEPTLLVTHQAKFIDEIDWRPYVNTGYVADLGAIKKGLIVVEKAGVILSADDMIALFQSHYQEF
jgi:hypothetical protein